MSEKMKVKTSAGSHHFLTSRCQYFAIDLRGEGRWRNSVRGSRWYILTLAMAALFGGLSPAHALAKQKPKQQGEYDITVSGYYRGTGKARASEDAVFIEATLKDDAGRPHKLTAPALARDPERHYLFSGRGSLGGMAVLIDGRVDVPDARKTDVLKAGRIVFTFKVISNGRHGRGGGEKRGNGNSGGGGGGGGGAPNPGTAGTGNPGGGTGNPGAGAGGAGNPGGNPGRGNPGIGSARNGNGGNGNAGTTVPGNGTPRRGGDRSRR